MNNKVRLSVLGFSFNQTRSGVYGLVLAEENGLRRLMIVVGAPEAQSIAFELQGLIPPRPLAHDLIKSIVNSFGIKLLEINILRYEDGIFFSELVLEQDGKSRAIDSRTSDAVALALRTKTPIYTTEDIMQNYGVVLSDTDIVEEEMDKRDSLPLDYSLLNEQELQALLDSAIESEDYELASELRDQLEKIHESKN